MELFAETDYKRILRARLKEFRHSDRQLNLKTIARRIPLQYTYLSRALNDDKTHLNEDHLFAICRLLEFMPDETEYLSLLRQLATSSSPTRKNFLEGKISRISRVRTLNASIQDFDRAQLSDEIDYLLDATSVVVHVSLDIPEIAKNPRRLCGPLRITPKRLQAVLHKLNQLNLIELSETGEVQKVNQGHIHYSKDHPLMRSHQMMLKTMSSSRLIELEETQKVSFMATFSADSKALEQVRLAFETFIKQVEKIAVTSQKESTYQLTFDLFPWF